MPGRDATVRVLFFSILREKTGETEVSVAVPDPPTGEGLLDRLEAQFPVLAVYRPVVRLAVNREYASGSVPVRAGDEVALITPVSGG